MKFYFQILTVFLVINGCLELSTKEEFVRNIISDVYDSSYSGIVTEKFVDKKNRGRKKIVLNNGELEIDFVYEKDYLYDYIQVNDSIIKETKNFEIKIINGENDTIIPLKFGNLADYKEYENFIKNLSQKSKF